MVSLKVQDVTCKAGLVGQCSHVVAVALILSNYILENSHIVGKTSNSLPFSWNKGKKRSKTPRKLHESVYESSKRKRDLYNWDSRQRQYRRQFSENLEQHTFLFVRKLKTINKDKLSMWEMLVKVIYQGFVLDDNDKPLQDRCFRITVSFCKKVVLIRGEKKKKVDVKLRCFD